MSGLYVDGLYAEACRITPGGAQTLSKRHDRYGAGMPAFLESGQGVKVFRPAPWEAESRNSWIDWIASLATVTLGHAHPIVTASMVKQLERGGSLAMPHPLEVSVGRRFLDATGWPDGMVRWVSTGSEATEAAVRTARIATGRDVVLTVEGQYHGWHSTWTAAKPVHPGVPESFRRALEEVPGTLASLRDRLAYAGREMVAAVILEPCADTAPDPVYLQAVVDLAHQHGALVIADEIIAGFRWHEQGAMLGTCGVRPDLVCFGKAIANGAFPIAALVGSAEIMQHSWPVSGTANGHPVGLAAVQAVLDVYEREQPLVALHQAGRTLWHGLKGLMVAIPESWSVVGGDDPRPVIKIQTGGAERDNVGQTLLVQELACRGVLWHPAGAGNAMAGHGPHVAETLDAFAGALAVVAEALGTEHPETWLVGEPGRQVAVVRG